MAEGERETDREREREREGDTHTHTHTQRQTEKQTERERERERERQRGEGGRDRGRRGCEQYCGWTASLRMLECANTSFLCLNRLPGSFEDSQTHQVSTEIYFEPSTDSSLSDLENDEAAQVAGVSSP